MQQFDVIIIGAGAAGLMCAGVAAQGGKSVLLLDHADKPGKKILISGGGRCNFTNRFATAADYISQNPHFCKSALARFTAADFISMINKASIAYHERNHGQLFCDDSAQQIVDMLIQPCKEYGVKIQLRSTNTRVKKNNAFEVQCDRGGFRSESLVVATGGLSIPKMGATPFGLKLAKQFGLETVPTVAGLAPFTFTGSENEELKSLAGISLDVSVCYGNKVFREAMLFTHRGLSGPAMLQISSYWQPGDELDIDLLPDCNIQTLLTEKRQLQPQARLSTLLSEQLPKRLARLLTRTQLEDPRIQELNEKQIKQIANGLHHWRLKPNGTEGYRTAEVTVGGVDTNELSSKTMESKKVPGLYFIGEVVDVTGHLGGFNFQWAWSSGYTAGLAVSGII